MRRKNRKKMPKDADLSKSHPKTGKTPVASTRSVVVVKKPHSYTSSLPEVARKARSGHLLYGHHTVLAALQNSARRAYHLFLSPQTADQLQDMQHIPAIATIPKVILDRQQLDHLIQRTPAKTGMSVDIPVHQGFILHCAPLETVYLDEWLLHLDTAQPGLRILVLDQVTDPRNIGAIMRSALALGASAILMTDRHAPEESGALAKTAAGALEKLFIIRVTNLARAMEALREVGFTLAGLEASGTHPLERLAETERLGLVLGSEGAGMRRLTREGCDHLCAIAIDPESESLNVSVAASIALYATRFER